MSPEELRTLAWKTFDCDDDDAPFCGQKAGRRCINASGVRCLPHKARIDQARGWAALLARQSGYGAGGYGV